MNRKFSPKVKKIIQLSREEALRLKHNFIGTEHLLLGMISDQDSLAVKVLNSLDVDLNELKFKIEENGQQSDSSPATGYNVDNLPLNRHAEKVIKVTFLEAKLTKNQEIRPEHLMLSILKHKDNVACKMLEEFDVDYNSYKSELEYVRQENDNNFSDFYPEASAGNDAPMEEEEDPQNYTTMEKQADLCRVRNGLSFYVARELVPFKRSKTLSYYS